MPLTNGIGLMDFHRAEEAIEIGKTCINNREFDLSDLVDQELG